MEDIGLQLIDLEKLISKLTMIVDESEGQIISESFKDEYPLLRHLRYFITNTEIERRGRYPLTLQDREEWGLFGSLYPSQKPKAIGYIFVESGYKTGKDAHIERYERLKIRIKDDLSLKDGNKIPNCKVEFLKSLELTGENKGRLHEARADHTSKNMFWSKADLSRVLPIKFFVKDDYARTQKINGELLEQFQYAH